MTPDEQRQLVLEHLERRERIVHQTREQLAEREKEASLDPLAEVAQEVRIAAEDEYYAKQGKRRYNTSDGRTIFLTPEEIAKRRRAKSRREKRKPRYYGIHNPEGKRDLLNIGFNAGAVILALMVVYLILH
jgi:hypothetical protein